MASSSSQLPSIESVYPRNKWFSMETTNAQLDPQVAKCRHQIMISILQGHPLWNAFHDTARAPLVYLQQFWGTLQQDDNHLIATIDNTSVTLSKRQLQDLLSIPPVNYYPNVSSFVSFHSESRMCADFLILGYTSALKKLSDFHRKFLTEPWQTLFFLVNKCLSPKHVGADKGSLHIYRIFHGIVFNHHYDYVSCIWEDLLVILKKKSTKKYAKTLPYQRFFALVVRHFMRTNPAIRRRPSFETFTPPKFTTIRKPEQLFPIPAMVIPQYLLNLADPTDSHIISYCSVNNIPIHAAPVTESEDVASQHGDEEDSQEDDKETETEQSTEADVAEEKRTPQSEDVHSPPVIPAQQEPYSEEEEEDDTFLERRTKRRQKTPPPSPPAQISRSPSRSPSPRMSPPRMSPPRLSSPRMSPPRSSPPRPSPPRMSPSRQSPFRSPPALRIPSPPAIGTSEFVSKSYFDSALQVVRSELSNEFSEVKRLLTVKSSNMPSSSSAGTPATKEDIQQVLNALFLLSDRVIVLEQTCRSQAESSKRRHVDQDDDDHHEGEKRRRVSEPDAPCVHQGDVQTETAAEQTEVQPEQHAGGEAETTIEDHACASTLNEPNLDAMMDDYELEITWTSDEDDNQPEEDVTSEPQPEAA